MFSPSPHQIAVRRGNVPKVELKIPSREIFNGRNLLEQLIQPLLHEPSVGIELNLNEIGKGDKILNLIKEPATRDGILQTRAGRDAKQ